MASRANKITVRVTPSRRQQTMSIHATGRFGKTSLSIPPTYQQGQALSAATDEKAYWNAVLVLAQAMVLSLP
jgi:hypothetical protein